MLRGKKFWEAVEEGLTNENCPEGERIGLFDITNAVHALKKSLVDLPEFLENRHDCKVLMKYYTHSCGCLFSLNYYRDNNNTKKEDVVKIQRLMDLKHATIKIENNIEGKENVDFYKEKIAEGIRRIIKDSEELLREEVARLNLKERLSRVQDKVGYLDNFMRIKYKRVGEYELSEFLLDLLNTTL